MPILRLVLGANKLCAGKGAKVGIILNLHPSWQRREHILSEIDPVSSPLCFWGSAFLVSFTGVMCLQKAPKGKEGQKTEVIEAYLQMKCCIEGENRRKIVFEMLEESHLPKSLIHCSL